MPGKKGDRLEINVDYPNRMVRIWLTNAEKAARERLAAPKAPDSGRVMNM